MSVDILLIDDDRELCSLLTDFLRLEGFRCESLHDGRQAVDHCRQREYGAIVLDIMLPGLQGLDVLRELRRFSSTPVLMLTAKGDDTDRIVGLEMGADDYLPKPCNPRELAARLRAILRRANSGDRRDPVQHLQVGLTELDTGHRSATYDGRDLGLTSAEFNVLRTLMDNAGSVVDKETLSVGALGRPLSAYDRSIDVHVSKIRKKLAAQGAGHLIVSVRGIGYQFTRSAPTG
jgi:DNA-binding response OmpR family regulator